MSENIYSNFIGPKGENISYIKELINIILDHQDSWRKSFFPEDPSLYPAESGKDDKLKEELLKFLQRSEKHLPFFHPRYAAQMAKDPGIPTILGYLTFMLSNPNNHAYEGGPVTTEMEMEVADQMLKFTGLNTGWGHLTSGGSLANMEALWAARDFYPEGTVYFSEVSHYSWKRISSILRIKNYKEIPVDNKLRMDLNILEDEIKKNGAMLVMANLGSTGAGSVDDIKSILELKKKYGFHLHVDAAYGGFVRSVILDEDYNIIPYNKDMFLSEYVYEQLKVLGEADSLTIDPHKHGLISYGAGAVLYKNEGLRDVVLNTAPYTYHKQDKPNIGMFSLEGSRPGAMAAACYLTYKVMPLNETGTGSIIKNALAASKKFYELIEASGTFKNLNYPDLDINCVYKPGSDKKFSALNTNTKELYAKFSVEAEKPQFIVSKFVLPKHIGSTVLPGYEADQENLTALRVVFMKHWGALNDYYYVRELVNLLTNA
jgi:glutamate/tyrosine decarboxylase-like PLP-dependent enzyme